MLGKRAVSIGCEMKLLCSSIRMVLLGFVAALVVGGGSAKADFIFGTPTNLGPTVNSSAVDECPWISADGLELFFCSTRPGGYGNYDLAGFDKKVSVRCKY